MKRNIVCLLLAALSIIILPLLFAQQDQNSQGPDPEIAALKKRILEIESKLQTVENLEKMELAAKLADANTKLLNAEIDKFKRELKDANNEWLRTWSLWFVGILGFLVVVIGGAFWSWLRSRADQLIANSVERSLNGFKEAVKQVDILKNQIKEAQDQLDPLKNQIKVLEKENAISVLRLNERYHPSPTYSYPEKINALSEQTLLDVFGDEMCDLYIIGRAAQVLTYRQSPRLLSPLLELLNSLLDSVVDKEIDEEWDWATTDCMKVLVKCLEYIPVQETYEELTKFLDRLLSIENSKDRNWLLTYTVRSLISVIFQLNENDSIPTLRRAIPYLQPHGVSTQAGNHLAWYFDRIKDPEAIKEILLCVTGVEYYDRDMEEHFLKLLEEHDAYIEFVHDWRESRAAANTESEDS